MAAYDPRPRYLVSAPQRPITATPPHPLETDASASYLVNLPPHAARGRRVHPLFTDTYEKAKGKKDRDSKDEANSMKKVLQFIEAGQLISLEQWLKKLEAEN